MNHRLATAIVIFGAIAALGARRRPVDPVPTFNRDVAPILQQHCQTCHRSGGIAPFSLDTFHDASRYAHLIAVATRTRRMPPWKPVGGCGEFRGERRLTAAEIETIGRWITGGKPQGDPRDLPVAPVVPTEWKLGAPDVLLAPEEVYAPPNGDSFRCFVIPRDKTAELLISAVDFAPLARENVHHAIAYVDSGDVAQALDDEDPGPGYGCMAGPRFAPSAVLGGWFPGAEPFVAPQGVATRVGAGDTVVLQIHYHVHHHARADQTQIALYLARAPIQRNVEFLAAENVDFTIPAGTRDHRVTGSVTLPFDIDIYAAGAHMHLLGRRFELKATLPDGSVQCLLRIDDWDPGWQGMYQYMSPVSLPAGTVLESVGTYDNSSENPRNPHFPPREVHWGEEAFNEMLSGYLAYSRR